MCCMLRRINRSLSDTWWTESFDEDRLVCRSCVWRGCGQSPGTLGCGATTKPISKMWSDILLAYSRHQVRFGTLKDRELKLCDPFGKVCGNWDWHKKWICMVHVACNNGAVSIFRTCLDIQQLSSAFQRIVLTVLFLWWSFESIDQCHYESKGLFYYHHITCISTSHGHC